MSEGAAGAGIGRFFRQTGEVLEMIKFQHTVFALPFALSGMIVAAEGWPPVRVIGWIVACCVFARTAAMAFNRWADAEIDARNPRTADRALPAGRLSGRFALGAALVSAALFVASAAMLNSLALILSPVALAVLLGYSYTKRFTSLCHFVLGLALGIAPIGAWVAVRESLDLAPLLMGLGVLLWTAGFDLIYALQDRDFDAREGLHSIPVRLGASGTLTLSAALHAGAVAALASVAALTPLGVPYLLGVAAVAALLAVEHFLVRPDDLSRVPIAFFHVNSAVGLVMFGFTALDVFWPL